MLIRQNKINQTTSIEPAYVSIDIPSKEELGKSKSTPTCSKKSLWEGIKEIYSEFCSNTSIHGFQYFGQQRPWTEKIFWIFIFIISIYYCTSIIVKIYVKWDESPVIVSFSERSTPIWNIPFPAVTICPEIKRGKKATDPSFKHMLTKLQTFIKDGQKFSANYTSDQLQETLTLMHLCDMGNKSDISALKLPTIDYVQNLNKLLPHSEKYLSECKWFGNETDCNKLFIKVYTDEGICFTFNSLRGSDLYRETTFQHQLSIRSSGKSSVVPLNKSISWSLEQGYPQGSDLHTYPARVLSSGSKAGLIMALNSFKDEMDYSCRYVTEGFKILLHSSNDVPSVSKHFVRIAMHKEALIAVKPKMITTSADIAAYHPHKRQCYLNKDRHLKFYKVYSQNNCERECLTNFTLTECGCVKFSMPRTPDMRVCGEDKISCYTRAKEKLMLQQFSEGLKNTKFSSTIPSDCNCMPACTSLDYETEISEGSFSMANTNDDSDPDVHIQQLTEGKKSILSIYFKENQFITSRRSEVYGLTELLANFGGVCGLFMGISILSLVEMLYHFTLRLWSNMMIKTDVKLEEMK